MKGVEFEVINLDLPENAPIAQQLDSFGFRNVPITTSSLHPASQWVTGFNVGKIAKLI